MSLPKKILGILVNFTLMAGTFFAFFLIFEGSLRICRLFEKRPIEEKLYEYDPVLGWRTRPHLQTVLTQEGRKISITTNARGFRGPEVSYARIPGRARVLVLGKSFAQATQVQFEELFSERLRILLSQKTSAEVINAGTAGHSTDQQLLFFRAEGARYLPDLTVLMFHDNDIWYNDQDYFFDKAKPHFHEAGGRLVLPPGPVPSGPPGSLRAELKVPPPLSFPGIKRWLAGNSLGYQWARKKIRESPVLFRLAAHWGLSGKNLGDIPDDFRAWKRHRDPDIDQAWKITEALVIEIRRRAEAIGSQFVIFYVPSRPAILPEHWEATKVRYGLSDAEWNVNQIAEDLGKFCRKNGISLIEPTADFIRASHQRAKPLYYAVDSHWTPEGHQVAAEVLARWILANPSAARKAA